MPTAERSFPTSREPLTSTSLACNEPAMRLEPAERNSTHRTSPSKSHDPETFTVSHARPATP